MHTDKNVGVNDLLSFRNSECIDLHVLDMQQVFVRSLVSATYVSIVYKHTFVCPLCISKWPIPILNKFILLIYLKAQSKEDTLLLCAKEELTRR